MFKNVVLAYWGYRHEKNAVRIDCHCHCHCSNDNEWPGMITRTNSNGRFTLVRGQIRDNGTGALEMYFMFLYMTTDKLYVMHWWAALSGIWVHNKCWYHHHHHHYHHHHHHHHHHYYYHYCFWPDSIKFLYLGIVWFLLLFILQSCGLPTLLLMLMENKALWITNHRTYVFLKLVCFLYVAACDLDYPWRSWMKILNTGCVNSHHLWKRY